MWADVEIFRGSPFPVWVFDVDHSRVLWANEPALDLWDAASMEQLAARDLSLDMSTSVRNRLRQCQERFWQGVHFDEHWTIFPLGKPRTLLLRFRGCLLESGRMAMLSEGQVIHAADLDNLRSTQALLYTDVMVTTYSAAGDCTYANPAAHEAFPGGGQPHLKRFMNPVLRAILAQVPGEANEGSYLSEVATSRGPRTHAVEVRQSIDPVDGNANFLITEVDVTEQEKAKHELSVLASQDALTGLFNRTYLAASTAAFMEHAALSGSVAALLLLDIDRFKLVNDALGNAAGDTLLREISQRLSRVLPETALLSRLGGDEFCCMLSAPEGEKAFLRMASALLKELRRPILIGGHDLNVSASVGLSVADNVAATFDTLLSKADLALFDAKGDGGNRARLFRPQLAERRNRYVQVDAELRDAMTRNRLELFYQPRISLGTGKIVAAEALIRLNSASGSLFMPGEFIPIAEATGRIGAIGRWVMREAVRHLVMLRNEGNAIDLSVNVSPKQFADPSFLTLLRQVRPMIDAVQGDIELEITENILIDSDRRLQRVMQRISKLGYKLAIDDFGTAYSNLASLTRYPISCIKIDRTLVGHKDFRLLVTGVMTIARVFGAKIVAEGVETETQRRWLADNLCDEYQGFLFSKPVPFAELQRLVAAER